MATPALELHRVTHRYAQGRGEVTAVHDASATVSRGEIVALTGRSGSGKTTLLLLAAGLLRPTRGRVAIRGRDLTKLDPGALTALRRRELGFVFQHFNLVPGLDAVENVALPLRLDGRPRREAGARAAALLERVGLGERKRHTVDELSGGEMQRVAVARALVAEPVVVFADEPTGNLDRTNGEIVLELLVTAAAEAGAAVLVATHDGSVAKRCDRVLQMADGRLASVPAAATVGSEEAVG